MRRPFEPSPQDAEGEGRLSGDDSVSKEPQSVHPIGQPISASTNSGFKTRPAAEVVGPSVPVAGRRRPRTAASVRVTLDECVPFVG